MHNKWFLKLSCLGWLLSGLAAGCRPATPTAANDKLAEILARGTLAIATDPAYPPQSELVAGAARAPGARCGPAAYTAAEFTGFDIDVAREIAQRLGVEPCFVTPSWTLITSGNWGDRWDISVGSMALTAERMEALYFAQPYAGANANFFVHQANTIFKKPGDLSGKRVGVQAGTTYELYLQGRLVSPGQTINVQVKNAVIKGYDADLSALQDLAAGDGVRLEAVLTDFDTGQRAIQDGLPLRLLADPVFYTFAAPAIDKKSGKDPTAFVRQVTEIIQQMHRDGALLKLSQQYYGYDQASAAGAFDLGALGQLP